MGPRPSKIIFLNPRGPAATLTLEPYSTMPHPALASLLASLTSGSPVMYIMMLPISVFVIMGVVAVVAIAFRSQERERWHETARMALEKGLPVPAMPTNATAYAPPSRHRQRMALITPGLINVAIGVGLYAGLSAIQEAREGRLFALVPGLIGVALILSAVIDMALSPRIPDAGDNTPKS